MAELSVYNWGTFSNLHTGRFDHEGTLITGHTGAGKSTFIDALQMLMLRPKDSLFNFAAAQQGHNDRSLMTYVRGRLGSVDDSNGRTSGRYKRPKATVSGVRALYRTDRGTEVTLAALFWVPAAGTTVNDINRGYVIADRNLSLKELLDTLRGTENKAYKWSLLEARYNGDEGVKCTQNFELYARHFRKALYLEDDKAPALLARAMGLKKIDDLTALVRDFVLEEPDTREKAKAAIAEFDNLNAIHAELDEAQRRKAALDRVPEWDERLRALLQDRARLQKQLQTLPLWYGQQRVQMLSTQIATLEAEIQTIESLKVAAREDVQTAQRAYTSAMVIYQTAGGDSLDQFKEKKKIAEERESEAQEQLRDLQILLPRISIESPPDGWSAQALGSIKAVLQRRLEESATLKATLTADFGGALALAQTIGRHIDERKAELAQLEAKPDSAIHWRYQAIREQLAAETGIAISEMPFLGELIDIKPEESAWHGAIERALGFHRLRLLVEARHRKAVTEAINGRHLGLRFGVQVATHEPITTTFRPRSFLRKLQWKKHPFADWLKRHVSEQTLDCADSVEEMQSLPFSMTVTGLIHRKQGSFEKNDATRIDDVNEWYIGFNNEARKARLREDLARLQDEQATASRKANDLQDQMDGQRSAIDLARRILELEWPDIDVDAHHAEVERYEQAIQELLSSAKNLESTRASLERCSQLADQANQKLIDIERRQEKEELRLAEARSHRERQMDRIAVAPDPEIVRQLMERLAPLTGAPGEDPDERERIDTRVLNAEIDDVAQSINTTDRQISGAMTTYKKDFRLPAANLPDRGDVGNDFDALCHVINEWIDHYKELVDSRLPVLRDRFQDSLNRHATQSLTAIFQAIQMQEGDILERIEQINQVLERTEFDQGTFLSLKPIPLRLEFARVFDEQLREVIRLAAAGQPAAHFSALRTLMEVLKRATDPATRGNRESLCQLDARYRMEFAAIEWRPARESDIDATPGKRVEVDFMRNTGGKSGGEKESFSGMVVAAALAYVLTPHGALHPSYSSVFLDEAFSNTSDQRAKRVLKVFKELGLHLNLLTPYKNVELARKAVRSALIVEIDGNSNSDLYDVTWEEIDRQRIAAADAEVRNNAQRLGVSYETISTDTGTGVGMSIQ